MNLVNHGCRFLQLHDLVEELQQRHLSLSTNAWQTLPLVHNFPVDSLSVASSMGTAAAAAVAVTRFFTVLSCPLTLVPSFVSASLTLDSASTSNALARSS